VYGFVSNPGNLPRWATAFCKSVSRSNGDWIVETPQGPVKIRFADKNEYGILDHYVSPAPSVEIFVPMRVVANGSGSEVLFTLFHSPGMSEEAFAADAGMVERDLRGLKSRLESGRG
jgi:hypothetical protein